MATKLTAKNATRADWINAIKPFDRMTCEFCLSMHADGFCGLEEHKKVTMAARKAGITGATNIRKLFPVFVRLRKRFVKFYPKETSNA